jgi:hypothetical protein
LFEGTLRAVPDNDKIILDLVNVLDEVRYIILPPSQYISIWGFKILPNM